MVTSMVTSGVTYGVDLKISAKKGLLSRERTFPNSEGLALGVLRDVGYRDQLDLPG